MKVRGVQVGVHYGCSVSGGGGVGGGGGGVCGLCRWGKTTVRVGAAESKAIEEAAGQQWIG